MSTGCTVYVFYAIYRSRAVRKFSKLFAEKGLYSSFKLTVVTEHVLFLRSTFVPFVLHTWNYLKFVKNISESASNPAGGYIQGTVYSWCRHGLDNAWR
jgi:hypothetical protein